ncbi:MAG: glycoside hydrolase family 5 protein [Oscillochloris sp.]|nr:glycoside hydrolase family 5 protein [Oscillochloris sp.]
MNVSARLRSSIVLLFLLVPLLAACSSKPSNTPSSTIPTAMVISTPDTSSAAATAVPTTAVTGETPTTAPAPTTAPEAPTATPEAPTAAPTTVSSLQFGIVGHLYYTDRDRVLQLVQNAGFDWVRQQVVWRDIEDPVAGIYGWDELDRVVSTVNAYNLKLLVNIVQSPDAYNPTNGLPADTASLGNFVEKMAQRYGDKIQAYEIWNEPNLAHENGGNIVTDDVGHYVEILKVAYTKIKAVNPNALVLAAASSSSGVTNPTIALSDAEFYKAMYTYNSGEVRNYFDVQAVHPGGSANPPDTFWPDNPSTADGWTNDPTFYFRHVEDVRDWMESYNMADKPIWITEYGWATANDTPGYEFGNQVSMQQQADYITGAIQRSFSQYPWVTNMFLWNINFAVLWGERGNPQHEQASFAILNADWSPRPSYLAIQSLISEIKQKQGR